MSISGGSSRNSFLPNWLSFDNPTQLFQLFMGDGQHAFSAHGKLNPPMFGSDAEVYIHYIVGLGGCSLINAGVFLRADEATLNMSPWPSEIRNHPSELDDCKYVSKSRTKDFP